MHPDFLTIGHISRDLSLCSQSLGGTATFGSITAKRLGLNSAIITSMGPEVDTETLNSSFSNIPIHITPANVTTTFSNIYNPTTRIQFIQEIAAPIRFTNVPCEWQSTPLVLLGPLINEVDDKMASYFPNSIIVASIQGWLRQRGPTGLVQAKYWEGDNLLPYVDAVVVSCEDVKYPRLIDLWAKNTRTLILTLGSKGARIHHKTKWHEIPPFQTTEVDPTGAGDVFAAAYLVWYQKSRNPIESAQFASCAASFCVESYGTEGIPTMEQIKQRLKTTPPKKMSFPINCQ